MTRRDRVNCLLRVLPPLLLILVCVPLVTAHGSAGDGAADVPFWPLLFASGIGGLIGGVALARIGWQLLSEWEQLLDRGIHILIALIGVTLVAPFIHDGSTVGLAGTTVGIVLIGTMVVLKPESLLGRSVTVATGGVIIHRAIEGFALGAAYLSGAGVGIVTSVVITAHAAVEIAIVYADRFGSSPWGALARVAGIQALLIVTGALGMAIGGLPNVARSVIVSVVGGTLLVAGIGGLLRSI